MTAEPLSAESVKMETMLLRKRYNDLSSECKAAQDRLGALVERVNGFISTEEISAGKDVDAAEIAGLEAEVEEVEAATEVADHEHKTYLLMIERARDEEKTWKRDVEDLDAFASAKQSDASQLHLMLKDANDVRDAARTELNSENERLSEELSNLSQRLAEKSAKLDARRQAAAEHEQKVEEKLRGYERDIKKAVRRREVIVATGVASVDGEREQIAKIQGVFDNIAEAIGVSDADAIVEKFRAQEETYALLAHLHRTSRQKIESLSAEKEQRTKHLENLRYAAARDDASLTAPAGPKGAKETMEAEEAAQKAQRAARLSKARAKRVATTVLEANSALDQLNIMLQASTAPTEVAAASTSQETIFAPLRPGANLRVASTAPLKVTDLQPSATAAALGSLPPESPLKGGLGRGATTNFLAVASDAQSQKSDLSPPGTAGSGKLGKSASMPAAGSPGKLSKANTFSMSPQSFSKPSSPQKASRSSDEFAKSFDASMAMLQQLIKAAPEQAAATVAAAPADSAVENARAAYNLAPMSDGLESEVALAPLLIAHGGQTPFDEEAVALSRGAAEEAAADDSGEDDGEELEALLDREALKSQARKIVQKRQREGKTGRRKR